MNLRTQSSQRSRLVQAFEDTHSLPYFHQELMYTLLTADCSIKVSKIVVKKKQQQKKTAPNPISTCVTFKFSLVQKLNN